MSETSRFDNEALWERYGLTPDYRDRLRLVIEMIPGDARAVLDVGCGKGEIINAAATRDPRRFVAGTDAAVTPLAYVQTPTVASALPHLPFADKSFDLVMCLQVLEHLPGSAFQDALRELGRVARSHLIVGVPFAENLATKHVRCAACGHEFHADGHVRRFTIADTLSLFHGFRRDRVELVGESQKRATHASTWLQHAVAGRYYAPEGIDCPRCGQASPMSRRTGRPAWLAKPVGLVNRVLNATQKTYPYWMICRYRREND